MNLRRESRVDALVVSGWRIRGGECGLNQSSDEVMNHVDSKLVYTCRGRLRIIRPAKESRST